MCLGFESQLGPGPLSPGRRKEQPPSLPPVHLSRKPPGGGEGARGQRAGGARPDPARARPPLCEGSGGSASRGGRRSCSWGEGEWQPVKRHFRNVNIKIGAIQPRSCPPHPPAGLGIAFWAGAVAGKEYGRLRQGEEVVTIIGVLDCKLCFARVKFNFGAASEAAMRDAGRRLGGAPSSAAPITVFARGGTCPAVAAGPPHRRFCLGLPGSRSPDRQLHGLVQIAAVSSIYRDRTRLKA